MIGPDELVWVAAVRRGITYHRTDGRGIGTLCGRSTRTGQEVSRMRAAHDLAGEQCPRCTAVRRHLPPAAAPGPTTPARAAVTISDSGCPGGHHTLRET